MRITQDQLRKVIRDTISRRTKIDRGLMAVYLSGAMLGEDYLLGGAGDIDMVFIHSDAIPIEREIVALTEDIHMDIAHHLHRDYRRTRELRVHPWLGPTLNSCQILFDPQHMLDFIQASVRGQYDRSDHAIERARKQADHARQIWLGFQSEQKEAGPEEILKYLRALENAANAIAGLNGVPLTERRFLLNYPSRADAIGRRGLFAGLMGLLGAPNVDADGINANLEHWQIAYRAIPSEKAPARLHPARFLYYLRGFKAILAQEQPLAALWPFMRSWTMAVAANPESQDVLEPWQRFFVSVGLAGEGFMERVHALDAYLDMVEETLDQWAKANGAE